MKRILLTVAAAFAMVGAWAQTAETGTVFKNQVLFSPPFLIENTFMVSYERIFPTKGALRITPSVTLSNVENSIFWDKEREGWKIDVGYKAFLIEKGDFVKLNVYLGPYAMYRYLKNYANYYDSYYGKEENEIYNILGAGVDAGAKLTIARFVVDFSFGGGVRYPIGIVGSETATSIFSDNYKGITPRANLSLGIAF